MPVESRTFESKPPPGLAGPEPRKPIVIVGAGPVGLAAAIEFANFGMPSVVLDDNNKVSVGSRAICWSKRSLEIFDRLGVGDKVVDKGVIWQVGRTFHRDREIFNFDLLPEAGHKRPAFVNLQQYYVEEYLLERALSLDLIDLRFLNRVEKIEFNDECAIAEIRTPDGSYRLETEYLLACDGVRSTVRSELGLDFEGEVFEERFLIADIKLDVDIPSERRFWFEPTFHDGQSALLHKQPDDIYRIDLQLGSDADPDQEKLPERVAPRIEQVVGTTRFDIEWVSVYTFHCRRLERFLHGRVIFLGDSAHVVSPFGARGGNGGLQDVDNLCWKLASVLQGRAPASLLESYNEERILGADENIAHSTRTTKFMTPAPGMERRFRDRVFRLAGRHEFARAWVNSGRLSTPCVYEVPGTDDSRLPCIAKPGSVAPDAPQPDGWLIDKIGQEPILLLAGRSGPEVAGLRTLQLELNEYARARYLGDQSCAAYLVRPDQVIASRWVEADAESVKEELAAMWKGI